MNSQQKKKPIYPWGVRRVVCPKDADNLAHQHLAQPPGRSQASVNPFPVLRPTRERENHRVSLAEPIFIRTPLFLLAHWPPRVLEARLHSAGLPLVTCIPLPMHKDQRGCLVLQPPHPLSRRSCQHFAPYLADVPLLARYTLSSLSSKLLAREPLPQSPKHWLPHPEEGSWDYG